jgi:predicted nucleic acid-binding protein
MAARFLPKDIYLDTSIVVATIITDIPHSQASTMFFMELSRRGRRIAFSQVLRLELSQAIRNLASRPGQLPLAIQQQYRLAEWESSLAVRQQWMNVGMSRFSAFLAQFDGAYEVPLTTEIWEQSVALMARYSLRSLDAVPVATARAYALRHFATLDDHFNRVANLRVWLIRDS